MNERIRELAEQAEDWADNQNFYESDYRDYLMEKFAELIVRECVQLFDRNPGIMNVKSPPSTASALIKQHFGVES